MGSRLYAKQRLPLSNSTSRFLLHQLHSSCHGRTIYCMYHVLAAATTHDCHEHDADARLLDEEGSIEEDTQLPEKQTVDRLDRTNPQIAISTYASLLRRCANAKALALGKRVHAIVTESGHESNRFLGNLLAHLYGKCGSIDDACVVFAEMHERNVFSWAIMIAVYVESGRVKEALHAFQQMSCEGVVPDEATFVIILSVCCSHGGLLEGQRMHARIVGCRLLPNVVVETALVNMYGKCSSLENAWNMFNTMPKRNLISWNAVIATYAEHGLCKDALQLFAQMKLEGVIEDKVTLVSTLDTCANLSGLGHGRQIHVLLLGRGFESDAVVGTALVHMYGKSGCVHEASRVFQNLISRDVICWTAMIAVHSQNGNAKDALQMFQQMKLEGVVPNKVTVVSILEACANQVALAEGRIFEEIAEKSVVSWTSMITICSQQGQVHEALQFFTQMRLEGLIPDKVTFVSMLDACTSKAALLLGKQMHVFIVESEFELDAAVCMALVNMYAQSGKLKEAQRVVLEMPEKDVMLWTGLIAAYAQCEQGKEALHLFEQMEVEGMLPDKVSFISIIDVCAIHSVLFEGKHIHKQITGNGLESDLVLGTALVNMYTKCGCLEDAWMIFDNMRERSVVSWNAIIGAYAQHGQPKRSTQLFWQMQQGGIIPDQFTFFNILSAFSHTGLVDEGCGFFMSMFQDHGIEPTLDHYNCIIDLLARAGQLEQGEGLINRMPFHPNCTSWMTLLGACKKHLDVERGAHAAKHVFKLETEYASPYVLLSNIYAAVGRWEDSAKVRNIMKEKPLKLEADCSCVNANGNILAGNILALSMVEIHAEQQGWRPCVLSDRI